MTKTVLTVLMALTLLTACSTTPVFDTQGIATEITPQLAQTSPDTVQGATVLWGGIIIASTNLEDTTQLEVLAYPLGRRQKPQPDQAPLGRFLVIQQGYLETSDYAPGRLLTATGQVREIREGRVGESTYHYPVLSPGQLHLWRESGGQTATRLHFGVGVVFSN